MRITLTPEHIAAVNRQRRIIFQDDVLANDVFRTETVGHEQLSEVIDFYMSRLDEKPNQIDSCWFEWGEGNTAVWPSKVIPATTKVFPKWWEIGVDPVEVLLKEARKRGREVFFSYRINGSDNDDLHDPPHPFDQPIPLKEAHPDWLIRLWHPFWNFALPGVREMKLRVLREVAENYDFDGIQVDFARVAALFPEGQQWENRGKLTDFMRSVRQMLLEVADKRGRPFLLAARVPENLMGCHFDGMDVETWARENLVDMFVLGCRSSDVDIEAFRRITSGVDIKLYPCFDFHHVSDGYRDAPIEVYRGVYANWWRQRPDGVHTFNLMVPSPKAAYALGRPTWKIRPTWEIQCQVFREVGSPETLQYKDKVFYVQRRGGEQGPPPADFRTPRWGYFCTNMFAPLPAVPASDGKADTLLTLRVADDLSAETNKVEKITLRMAVTDPANGVQNQRIEVRINNILLGPACADAEWLVFPIKPHQLAAGNNLVGVRVVQRLSDVPDQIRIEKLELHVAYR